jgi:N-acetylglutamate synthase-like GNAT family acetyltransferase
MIRRPTTDDLEQVRSLLAAADLPALPRSLPLSNVLVALQGDAVIGAVALEVRGLRGLLRSVVVEPEHARKGVGASLLQSLVARAQELSLRELYLITMDAEKFFSKAGFVTVRREDVPEEICSTELYREQCPEEASVMRLRLVTRHV